jgi:hypothetical protein
MNSNHNAKSLTWKPNQEKTIKLIFINVCRHQPTIKKILGTNCYEENISIARGKPQQTDMVVEINYNLKYTI